MQPLGWQKHTEERVRMEKILTIPTIIAADSIVLFYLYQIFLFFFFLQVFRLNDMISTCRFLIVFPRHTNVSSIRSNKSVFDFHVSTCTFLPSHIRLLSFSLCLNCFKTQRITIDGLYPLSYIWKKIRLVLLFLAKPFPFSLILAVLIRAFKQFDYTKLTSGLFSVCLRSASN